MRLARGKGQGLTEYAMIGALILAVSIPAIATFGESFFDVLQSIYSNMERAVLSQATSLSQAERNMSGDTVNAYQGGPAADLKMTLQDGTVINLKGYPQDLKKYVEVGGSNGATTEMLAQLDSLILQLQKSSDISPMELASLKNLSNQGHRLANLEAAIENTFKQAPAGSNYNALPVTFEGKQYAVKDLTSMLGWYGANMAPVDIKNTLSDTNAGSELDRFLTLYFQAEASGALNDPAVRSVVSDMSGQIAFLSETLEDTTYNVAAGTFGVESIDSYQASLVTQYNSSQICTAGKNKDTGVLCQ